MKEFVLVEFIATGGDQGQLIDRLGKLGDNFQYLKIEPEWDYENNYIRITGQISSEFATMIKLQDVFLADRMRISYISEELKDKYRK